MTVRQDNQVPSVEQYTGDYPFDIKPAVSLGNHMEAGSVAACHAKTPQHAHLGPAIRGPLHMPRPQHIGPDVFRPKLCELPHSLPFRGCDRPPYVNRHARVFYCEIAPVYPGVNDWLRSLVGQTL